MPTLGTTYSHRHIKSLSLSHDDAFRELLALKFDVIRLCCYWDEIQPSRDSFDVTALIEMLKKCEQEKQQVVMTIGMKAPRWPEFYVPSWVSGDSPEKWLLDSLECIKKTVLALKHFSCIRYWQVENEPLDPSGSQKMIIPLNVLKKEIELVKSLDNRKVIGTLWGNELTKRKEFENMVPIVDLVGLDVYYKVPFGRWFYGGPNDSDQTFKKLIANSLKPIWIMELQAEPWEHGELVTKKREPRSMNPEVLIKNYERAKALNPQAILLWGYEYWYLKKTQGDIRMWDTIERILNN